MSRLSSMTFLGTCSGGGPIVSRACSAISLNMRHERFSTDPTPSQHWLVDCAEGTQLQIRRATNPRIHFKNIRKIFVTHMHADHVMGIIPLMNNVMCGIHKSDEHLRETVRMELYGPQGLRRFIRENLLATRANLLGRYAVHELVGSFDPQSPSRDDAQLDHHPNENAGFNLEASEDGLWRDIVVNEGTSDEDVKVKVKVDAGPIKHRIPCLGYVFTDRTPECDPTLSRRKAVILGDTSDPSAMREIAMDASVLVHEATNAWMPPDLERFSTPGRAKADATVDAAINGLLNLLEYDSDPSSNSNPNSSSTRRRTPGSPPFPPSKTASDLSSLSIDDPNTLDEGDTVEGATGNSKLVQSTPVSIREYAIRNGHSTPDMAGLFAKSVRAQRLLLTHFSTRFPDPGRQPRLRASDKSAASLVARTARYDHRKNVILEIERQATEAWEISDMSAEAARDLLNVQIQEVDPQCEEELDSD